MAKAHQDQVSWPYSAPQYYPQPRPYNLPSYPQGRVCQESCCRRMRGPMTYPHHLPPFPPPSLPCRPTQNNSFARPQPSPQIRGFLPVNPYIHPQTHTGHTQPPPPPGLHRPIPQGRYEYSDFYRYGNGVNLSSNNNVINNCNSNSNHQGLQHGILKQNANTYGSCNTVILSDQYPACSHYPSQEQESAVPSLDVRQFLATWQDKDEEVFESEQQQKSKGQFQEHSQNIETFKPLDCTKRNDPPLSMYGYNHDQMAPHLNYYNKGLQNMPNHQPLNEAAFKNSSYMSGNSFHSLPVETDCSYNPRPVTLSDSQHAGYERRIEKIFNPHRCNVLSDEQNHCVVEKSDANVKAQTSNDKSHYHLSASLECEDLFDDINKRKEDRQRNVVHPLCYQENFSQSPSNENTRKKTDIPHVSVKPNTTIVDYSQNNFETHNALGTESEGKALKAPPLKKWVQKQKKSDEELFSAFTLADQAMDFCGRENAIQQTQILQPNVAGLTLNANNNRVTGMASGISNVFPEVSLEDNFQSYGNTMNEPEKVAIECIYSSSTFVEPEMQVGGLTPMNGCLPNSSEKSMDVSSEVSVVNCDASNISSSCDLAVQEEHNSDKGERSPCSSLNENQNTSPNLQTPKDIEKLNCEDFSNGMQENQSLALNTNEVLEGGTDSKLIEMVDEDTEILAHNTSQFKCVNESFSETCLVTSHIERNPAVKSIGVKLKRSPDQIRRTTRRKRAFSLLTFWRNRNRLFPKSISMKKAVSSNYKPKCQFLYRYRETSHILGMKKRRAVNYTSIVSEPSKIDNDQELEVNVVLTSLVDGVCQIGEVSSQVDDISATADSEQLLLSSLTDDKSEIRKIDGNSNVVGWKSTAGDEKVSSTVESDVTEEDDSNLVLSDDFIKYTEGSDIDGSNDRVLHGILNWPHSEEEITSNNEKESIKVSLPWVKIFETHFKLPDDEKTLDIGPARIELRYSPAPVEYQPGHYSISKNTTEKKSSIFSVKKVLLKHNRGSSVERIPKMVIKKTGCEEYKSYIKDAKLRVVSIKNSNKDGKAEVIIEADRPLIESLRDSNMCQGVSESSRKPESPGLIQSSEVDAECKSSEGTSDSAKELHHCLLCQESFTSLDKLHNHENSLSHRHIDIVQRNVLHKLQKSTSGDIPSFQPLSATEIEYLNWRPNFPGYNHFYHNVPL